MSNVLAASTLCAEVLASDSCPPTRATLPPAVRPLDFKIEIKDLNEYWSGLDSSGTMFNRDKTFPSLCTIGQCKIKVRIRDKYEAKLKRQKTYNNRLNNGLIYMIQSLEIWTS